MVKMLQFIRAIIILFIRYYYMGESGFQGHRLYLQYWQYVSNFYNCVDQATSIETIPFCEDRQETGLAIVESKLFCKFEQ